jgi:gamma-glutamyltranspeptidase/glutathione hydrolase
MLLRWPCAWLALALALPTPARAARAEPVAAKRGMVVSENAVASRIGLEALRDGGTAMDAVVAAAFALAVAHPRAGNIGGGGFLLYRPAEGEGVVYDFREVAPAAASPTMFLRDGVYDRALHHDSLLAVGVPGSVAGLHMAWREHGKLPWPRIVSPAIVLARDGFVVSQGLARDLEKVLPDLARSPASLAQFSRKGVAYQPGERLRQPDLARTLGRIAAQGPKGFYAGETARLIEEEMRAGGGLVTRQDLAAYRPRKRDPLRGSYRGVEVLTVPPASSGGATLLQTLNVLEGYDLAASGFGSAANVHRIAEAMRRAFADRARHLGDPERNAAMPIDRLISKEYAAGQRRSIREDQASRSSPDSFEWPAEGEQTTHLSVVDEARNAAALTTTLEDSYGSKVTVRGAGFLLNNEMGDFNAGPGLTNADGLIGTEPNLALPGTRMLSSMAPTILARDGAPYLVLGSPGGRKIPNAVLLVLLNVVDFGMNVQQAVDAPRFHHQWLPDRILHEPWGLSPDTRALLQARGHVLSGAWPADSPTAVEALLYDARLGRIEAGIDRRAPDAAAAGR